MGVRLHRGCASGHGLSVSPSLGKLLFIVFFELALSLFSLRHPVHQAHQGHNYCTQYTTNSATHDSSLALLASADVLV